MENETLKEFLYGCSPIHVVYPDPAVVKACLKAKLHIADDGSTAARNFDIIWVTHKTEVMARLSDFRGKLLKDFRDQMGPLLGLDARPNRRNIRAEDYRVHLQAFRNSHEAHFLRTRGNLHLYAIKLL